MSTLWSSSLLASTGAAPEAGGGSVSLPIAVLSIVLISAGLLFFVGAVVGLVRFPDFYTRMHAAGKGDTLSSLLVILGFALYHLDSHDWDRSAWLVALKLVGICAFIMITSPTSTHALMNAGYEDGCKPKLGSRGNALTGGESVSAKSPSTPTPSSDA